MQPYPKTHLKQALSSFLVLQSVFTFHANSAEGSIHSFTFLIKRAGGDYSVDYIISELARNMDLIVIMDRLRVREIVQFTGEMKDGFPVYESIYMFDIETEDRHELMGSWKRNKDVKLCNKLVQKAKWSGTPIPPALELI